MAPICQRAAWLKHRDNATGAAGSHKGGAATLAGCVEQCLGSLFVTYSLRTDGTTACACNGGVGTPKAQWACRAAAGCQQSAIYRQVLALGPTEPPSRGVAADSPTCKMALGNSSVGCNQIAAGAWGSSKAVVCNTRNVRHCASTQ